MCPACITTAALVIGGTISTGGVTTLAVMKWRAKSGGAKTPPPQSKSPPRPNEKSS